MSKFDPKAHMLNMKGKDYLEVKWRIVWFKDENPNGSIQTEIVNYQPLVARAVVYNNDGVLVATGHGSANLNGKSAVWAGREVEKAETAAIGRALAHAGYGTQFDPDSDEDDYLADSPIQRVGGTRQNAPQTSQTPVLADLQNSTQDLTLGAETPVKSPAERLGTPSGQRMGGSTGGYKMGEFKTRCLSEFYNGNTFHMNGSLQKLFDKGLLPPTLTLEQALDVVRTRKEEPQDVSA